MKVELVKDGMMKSNNKLDCLSCGVCCYFPDFVGKKPFRGVEIGEDGWCVHYDKDKKCTKYNKRPIQCVNLVSGGEDCLMLREKYLQLNDIKTK